MRSKDTLEVLNKHLATETMRRSSVPDLTPEPEPEPETEQAESSRKVTLNLVLLFVTPPPRKSRVFVATQARRE